MGIELGRISGPLLAENLLRNGVDLAFEDDLLYLDVNNGLIGVHKNNPGTTVDVLGTTRTTNLISDSAEIAELTINTYTIQNVSGSIVLSPDQSTDPTIALAKLGTANLRISDKLIENITNNSDINIAANGTGKVNFNTSNVYVSGNLEATGNVTWDGDITFGSDDADSVSFNADVNSNLIPNTDLANNLGSSLQKWKTSYTKDIQTTSIVTSNITAGGVDLTLRVGNTWYVSQNGLDTNFGDHLHATFRTIAKALSVAVNGDEVVIFPGSYEEVFPLLVPPGVSVNGASIRAVNIGPTPATKFNNAFLLNADSTVENVTVCDFFYDPLNNTGYAFSFAPGYKHVARSPYVRNVTVITDVDGATPAGCGALVDGSVVDPTSVEAAMLFHAATFLVKGSNGLVITNGVKVEWLNSFTYYADTGIKLTNGSLGRGGLGLKFGGELRSINSANVYGTYGVTADGADTLAYLVGHNFGYIGSGLSSYNDPKNVIQANEIVESNNGKIYYESVDNKGDVRIGDIFFVSQETGQVTFDASAIAFDSGASISLEGPSSSTYIDATVVQTGNIRVYDNNVDSVAGSVNLKASSGSTYLNTNVFVTGNLEITNDVKVKGNLVLGNNPLDLITIDPDLTQDINPDVTNSFTLGSPLSHWNTLYIKLVNVDDTLQLASNTVQTLTTDTDLKFVAAGTGKIIVDTTDVRVDNNVTVDNHTTTTNLTTNTLNPAVVGTINTGQLTITDNVITTLDNHNLDLSANGAGIISIPVDPVKIDQKLTVTSTTTVTDLHIGSLLLPELLTQIGNYTQTGDRLITGDVETTSNATFLGPAQFYDFNITNNVLSTTTVDGDLKLGASNTNIVHVKTTDVKIDNDLTVDTHVQAYALTTTNTTTANEFTTGDISIIDNVIDTTLLNSNLQLKAVGTQIISIPTNDINLGQKLTVTGLSTFDDVNIGTALQPKLLTQAGDYTQYGNKLVTGDASISSNATFLGNAQFYNVNVSSNTISTTLTDSDLILEASGSLIHVKTTDVQIDNNLQVGGNVTINGSTSLKNTVIGTTVVTPFTTLAAQNVSGSSSATGFFFLGSWAGNLQVGLQLVQPGWTCTQLPGAVVTETNQSLQTITITGGIFISGESYTFSGDVTTYYPKTLTAVGAINQTGDTYITGTFANNNIKAVGPTSYLQTSDIKLYSNNIEVTTPNTNLVLQTSPTVNVIFENQLKISGGTLSNVSTSPTTDLQKSIVLQPNGNVIIDSTTALKIPVGNASTRTFSQLGEVRYNTTTSLYEGYSSGGLISFTNIYDTDRNTYITPEASYGANDNTIRFGINGTVSGTIDPSKLYTALPFETGGVTFSTNNISSSALTLSSVGTGNIVINDIPFQNNKIGVSTVSNSITLNSTGRGYYKFRGKALVIPTGTDSERRPAPEIGEIRQNTDQQYVEVFNGLDWGPVIGNAGGFATEEEIREIMNLWSLILG